MRRHRYDPTHDDTRERRCNGIDRLDLEPRHRQRFGKRLRR